MMRTPRSVFGRAAVALLAAWWLTLLATPHSVSACSPAWERPTLKALGPAQLVVVGRVGERVPGGRLFHVERWFNGDQPGTPIVIVFKEGEPIGDCSYPVATGEDKIIAPSREPDGRLYADLGTLQADPASADGQAYLDEATRLFGPGVVPPPVEALPAAPEPAPSLDLGRIPLLAIAVLVFLISALAAGVVTLRRRT